MNLIYSELDEVGLETFRLYKYALCQIGVDFNRTDVQEAVIYNYFHIEDAFRATIAYWCRGRMIEHPSAFLIAALSEGWKCNYWQDEWLKDPQLKNPCLKWWNDAAVYLGHYRDSIIADVNEDKHGNNYILFTNGKTMRLETAQRIGWERVLQYGIEQGLVSLDALHWFSQDKANPA